MQPHMNRQEREEFLAGVHVGVFSVASQDGGGPLAVPVWYAYSPGGTVNVSIGRASRKAAGVMATGRFTLCAQDERPPYKYVSVEGPVAIEEATEDERRALARRYLGPADGDAYIAETPGHDEIMLRMTPERWLTVDYGKLYG
jgi:PPOX class probable F420-dependent enzyme